MEILNKGEFQVSELEREAILDSLRKEVANHIVEMCVHSQNGSPFPVEIILKVMGEAKVKVNDKKSAKRQALEIIDELVTHGLPIKRARMRVIIHLTDQTQSNFIQELLKKRFDGEYLIEKIDSQ